MVAVTILLSKYMYIHYLYDEVLSLLVIIHAASLLIQLGDGHILNGKCIIHLSIIHTYLNPCMHSPSLTHGDITITQLYEAHLCIQ